MGGAGGGERLVHRQGGCRFRCRVTCRWPGPPLARAHRFNSARRVPFSPYRQPPENGCPAVRPPRVHLRPPHQAVDAAARPGSAGSRVVQNGRGLKRAGGAVAGRRRHTRGSAGPAPAGYRDGVGLAVDCDCIGAQAVVGAHVCGHRGSRRSRPRQSPGARRIRHRCKRPDHREQGRRQTGAPGSATRRGQGRGRGWRRDGTSPPRPRLAGKSLP